MKKRTYLLITSLLLLLSLGLTACKKEKDADIITTLYPHYDIATQIVKDKMSVSLLTPLGSEVHGYSPTAKDIVRIHNSKLFLYTSDTMERWVSNIVDVTSVNAVDLSKKYNLEPLSYENSTLNETDLIHYWTDPTTYLQLILAIKDEIASVDPENIEYYTINALAYYDEINALHLELKAYFEEKGNQTIFFFGHNAMKAFGYRYNLSIQSLSDHYQPDAELTPLQKVELKEKIKKANAQYLFIEELIDPKGANSLKNELELEGYAITILELHGYHNVSKKEFSEGVTYADLLRRNIQNLYAALNH